MSSLSVSQSSWPKVERLILCATRIIGHLELEEKSTESLAAETAYLYAGVAGLLTQRQLQRVKILAAKNVAVIAKLDITTQQERLLVSTGLATYFYVQPGMLEKITMLLMTVVMSSPSFPSCLTTPQIPLRDKLRLTERDKMLIYAIGIGAAESITQAKELHPVLLGNLFKVRDFYANQAILSSKVSASYQSQLDKVLEIISEPYPRNISPNIHWHNLFFSALAPAIALYDVDKPSYLPDKILAVLINERIELDNNYHIQRNI